MVPDRDHSRFARRSLPAPLRDAGSGWMAEHGVQAARGCKECGGSRVGGRLTLDEMYFGAGDEFKLVFHELGHGFSPETRELAYDWLVEKLGA